MPAETVQALVSLVGLILAIIGVPLLFVQLRELQRSVQSAAHAAIYAQAADFRSHLVLYPHLRKFFFDGIDLPADHEEYDRVTTIAELFLNYLEPIAVMRDRFGRANRASLDRFARHALDRSPVLKRQLRENAAGYSDFLQRLLPEVDRSTRP